MPARLVLTPLQKRALRQGRTVMAKRRGRPGRYRRRVARPRRALSTGYRGPPNQYKFIRETSPVTLDIGAASVASGVSIIAGTGPLPNTAMLQLPPFKMDALPGYTEFSALFANFKVDKIETILIPQWVNNTQPTINPLTGAWSATAGVPNLMITRVNTRYLPQGYTAPATAEASRSKLSQIVKKTRSLYGTRKWLKLTTTRPTVLAEILEAPAGAASEIARKSPWLPTSSMADQEFVQNDLLFADRLNGTDHLAGVYLYRMYHRITFRCGFLG